MAADGFLQCLVVGGDERLRLDAATGRNRYDYGPGPQGAELAMGSSTASSISPAAFAATRSYHDQLADAVAREGEARVYARETAKIRHRLLALLGHDDTADTDMVLAPSGTDIHLLAALLLNHCETRKLQTITLASNETGSSVGTAAAGRYFMQHLASGRPVSPGAKVDPSSDIGNITLSVRDEQGALRCEAAIEREIEAHVAAARLDGRRCLLVAADVSKTGLIAPALDTVFGLMDRHGDALDVMIDACQLRLSPQTLRAYLARGLIVAVTGSKFAGGPSFSGALLCPAPMSARLKDRRLPAGLADHGCSADWPDGWAARADLPERANLGLLLRWHAALVEWEAFLSLPPGRVAATTAAFAAAVQDRLRDDEAFAPLPSRELDRSTLLPDAATSYDLLPTIFPFFLKRPQPAGAAARYLDADETARVHAQLAAGTATREALPVRLGQPVSFSIGGGAAIAALRLCLSARLISQACTSEMGPDALVAMAMRALDAAAQVAALAGCLTA